MVDLIGKQGISKAVLNFNVMLYQTCNRPLYQTVKQDKKETILMNGLLQFPQNFCGTGIYEQHANLCKTIKLLSIIKLGFSEHNQYRCIYIYSTSYS